MQGIKALDRIIEKIKEYTQEYGKDPQKVTLGQSIAYDLLALTEKEIGPVAHDLFREGIEAVSKIKIRGVAFEVSDKFDDSIICS